MICVCPRKLQELDRCYLLFKEQKAAIYEIKTDSCLHWLPNKAKQDFKGDNFESFEIKNPYEAMKCLNHYYDPCISDSYMKVYRVTGATQTDLLKMDPGPPK